MRSGLILLSFQMSKSIPRTQPRNETCLTRRSRNIKKKKEKDMRTKKGHAHQERYAERNYVCKASRYQSVLILDRENLRVLQKSNDTRRVDTFFFKLELNLVCVGNSTSRTVNA